MKKSIPAIEVNQWLWWNSNHIPRRLCPGNGQVVNDTQIPTMNIAGVTRIPLQFKRQGIRSSGGQIQRFFPPTPPRASVIVPRIAERFGTSVVDGVGETRGTVMEVFP